MVITAHLDHVAQLEFGARALTAADTAGNNQFFDFF